MKTGYSGVNLSNFDFFSRDSGLLAEISTRTERLLLDKGDILFLDSDRTDGVYLIRHGEIFLVKSSYDGRKQILDTMQKGEIFNLFSALQTSPPSVSLDAIAATFVELWKISSSDFESLLAMDIHFSTYIVKMLGLQLNRISELALDLALKPVRARLAKFLVQFADSNTYEKWFTQEDIAAYVGTVRDVVGRLMREFEALGYLKRQHHQIILKDRESLEREAECL